MTNLILTLPIKPVSANALKGMYRGRMIKSAQARVYEREFKLLLNKFSKEITAFFSMFDDEKHALDAEFYFYFPEEELLTKNGHIKERRHDLDNMLKSTIDNLFSSLPVDDALVCSMFARKIPSDKHMIAVTLTRVDIPEIEI